MRIIHLSPGTGSYHCGACLRDQALARALTRRGHAVTLVPMYLPHFAADSDPGTRTPVRMGAVSLYLQHRLAPLRWLPGPVLRLLDGPSLLRWAGRRGGGTDPASLGALTVGMLEGEKGPLRREIGRLAAAIEAGPRPDVVCLSNALLAGVARTLRRRLGVPVVATLQGEAPFLDALAPRHRERAWGVLARRAAEMDALIAVSQHHARRMSTRLGLAPQSVHVVWNGIEVSEAPAELAAPPTPAIGYLSRVSAAHGLPLLVEAFLLLRERGSVRALRLRVAGAALEEGTRLLADLRARLEVAGARDAVDFLPNLAERDKRDFLRSLSVLSVPASADESFGLYLLEAMAEGVPVVQPRRPPFQEIIDATGGGLLCKPDDAFSLAGALERLLVDPEEHRRLGERGRAAVHGRFTSDHMAARFAAVLQETVARHGRGEG